MSKENIKLDILYCLTSLLDRANHDEYLYRISKPEALEFLNQNEKFYNCVRKKLESIKEVITAWKNDEMSDMTALSIIDEVLKDE